jgi:ribosomal protein L40E
VVATLPLFNLGETMNRKFAKYVCKDCGAKKISKKAECKECAVKKVVTKKKAPKKSK